MLILFIFSLSRKDLYLLSLGIQEYLPGERKEVYYFCEREHKSSKGVLYTVYLESRKECYLIGDLKKRKQNPVVQDLEGL